MALGGEIASMYVRLRPHLGNFAAEATTGVKAALSDVQAQANAAARANVASDEQNLAANRALATSYREIGQAAAHGSDQARIAARRGAMATAEAESLIGRSAVGAEAKVRGLRERLLGLGTIIGVSFGAEILVRKVKELTASAASVQKSAEVIKSSFGKSASEVIVRFGDTVASKLGISAELADATSARFGILFKNLGIGQAQAAGMTVNLEKLAGSLSAIRGVDPARAMSQITLAMLGNVRSLKQLGLAVDPASEKIAALKLGLISSIHDAFTPAIRAQAIYALATAHLADFQRQAAAHGGDYINVQRRLSAEWSNAKDILGTALLPMFTRYTKHLGQWLERMIHSGKLQHDFNKIAATTARIVSDVGNAIKTGWHIFQTAAGWVGGTKHAVEILLGVLAVSKLAGVGKGFLGIVNAIKGIGVAARAAAVMFGISSAAIDAEAVATSVVIKSALISTGIGAVVVAVAVGVALIITHWNTVKRWLVQFGHWIESHAREILFVPIVGQVAFMAIEVVKHFDDIKRVVVAFAHFFRTVFVHPIRAVENLFHDLRGVIVGVFRGMERMALEAALKIVEPFTHLPGFLGGGKFQSIKAWLQGQLAGLEGPAAAAANKVAKALTGNVSDGLKKAAKSLFGTPNAGIDTAAADAAIRNGTAFGKHVVAATVATVKSGTSALTKSLAQAMAQAVATAKDKVLASVEAAKKNLDEIGQKLAEAANKVIDKLGGAGSVSRSQEVAFKKLRDLIAGGGGTPEILRASQQLSSQMQEAASSAVSSSASTQRDRIKRQFADLTDEFNRGHINLATFDKRVAALLAKNHVTYKNAGRLLGKAFADGFHEKLGALHKQAGAISALPANLRKTGAGGDVTKIIQPLQVMRQQNERIATLAAKQRERQIKASEKAAAAAAKTNTILQSEKNTKVGMLPGKTSKNAKRVAGTGVRP